MPFLFLGSTGDHAGQSLIAWAIVRRLMEKGLRIGFLKPFGTGLMKIDDTWADPDAFLFKTVLKIQEPLEKICPYVTAENRIKQDGPTEIIEKIKSLAHELSTGKDLLLILGSKHIFYDDVPHSVPDITLISELNAYTFLVHRYKNIPTSLYSILSVKSLLKETVKGIIMNRVPHEDIREVEDQLIPVLTEKGDSVITLLPEDPVLSLWSIGEIREILEGKIIWGEEYLDRPVEGMTVGTSDLNGELLLFKRVYNKIILLGPSAESRAIAGILLTGNREPAHRVLEASKKSKIPLILVKEDSFMVKERLEQSTPTLTPADEDKMFHFTAMMDRDNSLNMLIQSLGLD
ncbi:AAA family ATPase [Thermodesulfobacteriota bacterium]